MRMITKLAAPIVAIGLSCTCPVAARAASPKPHLLGHFSAWTAARYVRNGSVVCYAYTSARQNRARRPAAILTVMKRVHRHPNVILSPGFAMGHGTTVTVSTEAQAIGFSAYGRDAFARDQEAAIRAFRHGMAATARTTDPRRRHIEERFSLRGFTAAYAAVKKACPA